MERVQLHSFACGYPVFPTPFVEKIVLSPLNGLDTLGKNHVMMYARGFSWAIILFCCSMFVFMPYYTVLILAAS